MDKIQKIEIEMTFGEDNLRVIICKKGDNYSSEVEKI